MKIKNILIINIFKKNILLYILILIVPLYGLNYEYLDFQDPSIIWEGVYRLSNNQKPYVDFGIPLGTGTFLIPGSISKFFGFSMKSLYFSSYILNLVYLFFCYKFLKIFKFSFLKILISLLFLSLSIKSVVPYYNQTAYIFSFISIYFFYNFFIIERKYFKIFLSAIFCSLSFFSKQDYGLVCLIFIGITFILNLKKFNTKELGNIFFIYISCISLPFLYYIDSNIWYWFNFLILKKVGQVSVLSMERTIVRHLDFSIFLIFYTLVLAFVFYQFKKVDSFKFTKIEILFYSFLIFIFFQNILCGYLSGSGPTANSSFVQIILPIFLVYNYEKFIKLNPRIRLLKIFLILTISTHIFIKPNKLESFILVNKFNNLQKYSLLGNLGELKKFIYKKDDLQFFNFKNYEKNSFERLINYKISTGFKCNFITVGELVMLYKHFKTVPCPDHPLWYTYGTSFFKQDLDLMKKRIKNNYYGTFLYQDMWEEGTNIELKKQLDKYYQLKLTVEHEINKKYNLYVYETKN